MATPLALEGDGLIENLFHFLWSKDDFGDGPRIFVPHTVVYHFTQPSAWYFTSLKSGKLKKKNKVNLTNFQIEHAFTKHLRKGTGVATDIVAYYLYQLPGTTTVSTNSSASLGNDEETQAPPTVIEYFDAAALHDFLFTREKTNNGILQRFVLPKGTHNATIRAIWSPKICLLERRVNSKSLFDKHYSVYERAVTFDGGGAGELFSRPEPVRGAMLPGEVQLLCEQIVDHVTQVSYHKFRISRMVLHLKSDADDRLWLLWCSSLRLLRVHASEASSMRPLDIVSDAQVPAHVSLGHVSHYSLSPTSIKKSKSLKTLSSYHRHLSAHEIDAPLPEGFQRCTSCASVGDQPRMLLTNYRAVLEHFQRFLAFLRERINEKEQAAIEWPPDERLIKAAGGVGFGILPFCERMPSAGLSATSLQARNLVIPPVIQYLHPTLTVEDFERHRLDPIFLHRPVAVCERCCLVYADYMTLALEANTLRSTAPAILRPQREVSDLKRRLDPLDPVSMATSTLRKPVSPHAKSASKPPPSAWKPIPAGSGTEKASKAVSMLTKSTLHALPPAPKMPDRIESLAEFTGCSSEEVLMKTASWSSGCGSGTTTSPGMASQDAQREETFFRELYHQRGQVSEGHPLQHMLDSASLLSQDAKQRKNHLKTVRASGTSLGKSASMGYLDSLLAARQSKQSANPYKQVQKLRVVGNKRTKQKTKGIARSPASKTKSNLSIVVDDRDEDDLGSDVDELQNGSKSRHTNQGGTSSSPASSPKQRFISEREARASEAHQEFLFAALYEAEQQLEHMESLASIVLPGSAVDVEDEAFDDGTFPAPTSTTVAELQALLSENATLQYPPDFDTTTELDVDTSLATQHEYDEVPSSDDADMDANAYVNVNDVEASTNAEYDEMLASQYADMDQIVDGSTGEAEPTADEEHDEGPAFHYADMDTNAGVDENEVEATTNDEFPGGPTSEYADMDINAADEDPITDQDNAAA
ncbi:hypothetical protein Poli38472_006403 [Pythium oligandrum]|uniref:Uncharacterized protein n=1 Tax=Pythium oligandrum TaxID=41045 RepID=A0A8K1C4Y1_PYTOL|nr:hypothetical protein Poli38472_006403 [Pythium oligandrum]|eukprot:TMW56393.1 hypothetical protein Poli38472_006403 [Pythium oligandrum]